MKTTIEERSATPAQVIVRRTLNYDDLEQILRQHFNIKEYSRVDLFLISGLNTLELSEYTNV